MHYGAMLVGQFLKAAEFGTGDIPAQPTYTIANVALEKLESVSMQDTDGSSSKLKTKGVLYFREVDRGWVLNRTNCECLAALFGKETNDWVGKRVTLFAADVRVGPKMDIGIRVRGSPDITKEITVMVKLPRRKPIPMKLVNTGGSDLADVFAACTTVEALNAAWAQHGRDDDAAKAAYKARRAILKPQKAAVAVETPPEGNE